MKITEDNLNEIIDLLNDLICDENLLTRTNALIWSGLLPPSGR